MNNMFDSWIRHQADGYKTCDQVIESKDVENDRLVTEKLRRLQEEDVIKRSADTRFVDKWIDKETIEGYKDEENPENNEEDEIKYSFKECSKVIFSHAGKYKLVFGKSRNGNGFLNLDRIAENDTDYLYNVMHSSDDWYYFSEDVKLDYGAGASIGQMLDDFSRKTDDEDSKDALGKAQGNMSEVFAMMLKYEA